MRKTAIKLRAPARQTRQAVGTAEAAALMGVHWSTPRRMIEKGILTSHECDVRTEGFGGQRVIHILDGAECEQDYLDYMERMADGGTGRRPREHLGSRKTVLEHLAAVEHPIDFHDACGSGEAAKILSVHPSFLTRLVKSGQIIGRSPWNPRGRGETRNWIFSRSSCHANVAEAKKLQASGGKIGRPRKLS